jgi:hypothetical protein
VMRQIVGCLDQARWSSGGSVVGSPRTPDHLVATREGSGGRGDRRASVTRRKSDPPTCVLLITMYARRRGLSRLGTEFRVMRTKPVRLGRFAPRRRPPPGPAENS